MGMALTDMEKRANLRHALASPIGVINLTCGQLRRMSEVPDSIREHLSRLERAAWQLHKIIDEDRRNA